MKKVLIVDDSTVIRKAIRQFLNDYDVNIVGSASNGSAALEMFAEFRPDVVTLDITMPGLDGFHVLDEMIKLDASVRIMVITALADKATGLKALKSGARGYLTKPFSAQKLQETLGRILE